MKAKLEAFMRGRNGMDRMNRGLVLVYVLLMIFNMFFAEEEFRTVNLVVNAISVVLVVIILARTFSKNLEKRRRESDKWSEFWWRFRTGNTDSSLGRQSAYKYITCEKCGTTCRVPAGKGKITVICPKCQTHFLTET